MSSMDQDPKSVRRPGGQMASTGSVTQSQLFPVLSQGVELLRRSFFLPALISLVAVVGLLASVGSAQYFNLILGSYLGTIGFYAIYLVCGRQKPWWLILSVPAVTIITMLIYFGLPNVAGSVVPCVDGAATLFQRIAGFLIGFVQHFRNAGLPEELLKSVPVFGCLLAGRFVSGPLRKRLELTDPLDGIIIGAASGLGFILLETLGVYVPLFSTSCGDLFGLQLLLARTLGGSLGHMAYSGYFGYFIGLSVLRPRYRWKILLTGYISAAALHAFWNAGAALGTTFLVVPGALALVCLGSAIVRARKMAGIVSTVIPVDMTTSMGNDAQSSPLSVSNQPSSLHIGTLKLDIVVGRRIRQGDVPGLIAGSQDDVVAEVNQNPRDASIIGLMNMSVNSWTVMDPRSGLRKVEPGKSVRLLRGTRINFGSIFGEVH